MRTPKVTATPVRDAARKVEVKRSAELARKAAAPIVVPKLAARVGRRPTSAPGKKGALAKSRGGARTAQPVTRLVRVKALDPCERCGPSTCVEQLYRVDEQVAGTATVHLVFFDRHGWYCVHGASCVAVRDVHAELKARRVAVGYRR